MCNSNIQNNCLVENHYIYIYIYTHTHTPNNYNSYQNFNMGSSISPCLQVQAAVEGPFHLPSNSCLRQTNRSIYLLKLSGSGVLRTRTAHDFDGPSNNLRRILNFKPTVMPPSTHPCNVLGNQRDHRDFQFDWQTTS